MIDFFSVSLSSSKSEKSCRHQVVRLSFAKLLLSISNVRFVLLRKEKERVPLILDDSDQEFKMYDVKKCMSKVGIDTPEATSSMAYSTTERRSAY